MRSALGLLLGLALVVPGCKKSHEEAVKATREQCVKFLAAADAKASCDMLASLTEAVAKPFGDVSNSKEVAPEDEEYLTKCMDSIADRAESCKDNPAYKTAMDKLFAAVAK